MENRNGYHRQNSGLRNSFRDGDFEEADVWALIKERKGVNYSQVGQFSKEIEAPLNLQRRDLPSAVRMIPRISNNSSSSNSSRDESKGVKLQSAPVKIPDWSKISKNKSRKKTHKYDYLDDDDDDDDHGCVDDGDEDSYDDDEEEEDVYDCKVPPHEFIANRLANSKISSFSVFEGVGRKLKGRDLSKVRNTVLTKTGFLE